MSGWKETTRTLLILLLCPGTAIATLSDLTPGGYGTQPPTTTAVVDFFQNHYNRAVTHAVAEVDGKAAAPLKRAAATLHVAVRERRSLGGYDGITHQQYVGSWGDHGIRVFQRRPGPSRSRRTGRTWIVKLCMFRARRSYFLAFRLESRRD